VWRESKKYALITSAVAAAVVLVPVAVAASTVVQSKICAPFATPTLTAPASGYQTSGSSVHVTGYAEPYMTVSLRRGSSTAGTVQTAANGTYAAEVPLNTGTNSLKTEATDTCSTTKMSMTISVVRLTQSTPQPTLPNTPAASTTTQTVQPAATSQPTSKTASKAEGNLPNSSTTPVKVTDNPPTKLEDMPSSVTKLGEGLTKSQKELVTTPNEKVTTERTWVRGIAEPKTSIAIYVNRIIAARVMSDDAGSYGALVQLKQGNNEVHVLANTSDGQTVLRLVNINLVSSTAPAKPATKPQHSDLVINIVIGAIALGGVCITTAVSIHTAHLRKGKIGGRHA